MTDAHAPGEGSTPEVVAAYWGGQDAMDKTLRKVRRRSLAISLAVAVVLVVAVTVFLVNQSNTSANTNAKVTAIRTDQMHNTKVSNQRAACQTKALDDVLTDVNLALSGDRNPADYAAVPRC